MTPPATLLQEQALAAELTASDPGQLYLLFVYQRSAWHYLRGTEKPPKSEDWKPRSVPKTGSQDVPAIEP